MKIYPNGLKVTRGEVVVLKERCKGCGFCVRCCPAAVLEISKEFNKNGYHFPVVKKPDGCINCGLCEMLCPDFAICSFSKGEKNVVEV